MRVFIAGFQHETNTFAPSKADWAAFEAGSGFPPYRRGASVIEAYRGRGIPIGGFIAQAEQRGWSLVASVWAGANPSAHVTEDAFERIAREIIEDLRAALADGGVDAVYLDLHGAAVTEHLEDPEGELLARIRREVGQAVPIVASLDLHANVTAQMLEQADALTAYRTYPHIDMADTGALAATLLARRLARSYGARVDQVLGDARTMADMGEAVAPGLHARELRYLQAQEWAVSGDDVLWRRSKLGLFLTPPERERVDAWMRAQARVGHVEVTANATLA